MNLNIDYLTFTVDMDKWSEPDNPMGWVFAARPLIDELFYFSETEFERVKSDRFYEYALACSITGARVDFARGKQGVRVQLPGSWWEGVREDQLSILSTIIEEFARNITRIDIAHDYTSENAGAAGTAAAYWLEHGVEGHKRTKLIPYKAGSTFYIGSRNSNRMLRVYDKGKQLKGDHRWRRCELELKGRAADVNAALLAKGLRPAVIIMRDVLATPTAELDGILETLLDGEVPNPIKVPRKKTNRYAWICEQVIPAWVGLAKENPEESKQALELLVDELTKQMVQYADGKNEV